MSGRKGMKHYSAAVKEEVRRRHEEGESLRSISREMGISRYTVQSWCGLRPETRLRQIAPLPKGRAKANKTIEDYEKENKRLKMEVELMRDFLQFVERKWGSGSNIRSSIVIAMNIQYRSCVNSSKYHAAATTTLSSGWASRNTTPNWPCKYRSVRSEQIKPTDTGVCGSGWKIDKSQGIPSPFLG